MSMDNLWAPWRLDYVKDLVDTDAEGGCFLCDAWANTDQDAQRHVVHRDPHGMILLNRYPYTNGHLLVAPGEHIADLPQLSAEHRAGLMELTTLAERLIQTTMNPQGINIGINVGRAAGAGLPGHLHIHLVPRWSGDTNFMGVVGKVRVIPQAMQQIYDEYCAVLPKLLEE